MVLVGKQVWKGKSFWMVVGGQSGTKDGLAILVGNKIAADIKQGGEDADGHFQWIQWEAPMGTIGLCNIYAPNTQSKREQLWDRLEALVHKQECESWVIGGCMNFVEFSRDKQGGRPPRCKQNSKWQRLVQWVLGVEDPWVTAKHCKVDKSAKFTWFNQQWRDPIRERLDRFYIMCGWRTFVQVQCIHAAGVLSDHMPIWLLLYFDVRPKPGLVCTLQGKHGFGDIRG
eukprot:TRINITY_DN26394_c0_g1_i1.p1 TRINITY_DN26394_c0_g1~~TRINITY_DN26394_c0_g1_i1.p1  ORF type:complete len:228 (-),score=24.88 TRINITY_DN26394_c0_g1_i1:388-1071(-)